MRPDWEIWLDAHISPAIALWMKEYTGLEVKSAYTLKHHSLSDAELFRRARRQGNVILISKDADFIALIGRYSTPPKLISFLFGNCHNRKVWMIVQPYILEMITLLTLKPIDVIELDMFNVP